MPARVDRCVQSLMEDPKFKPRKPDQTKEDAAWALCTWLDQRGRLRDSTAGVKVMENAKGMLSGPFKVVLPITGARRRLIEKADGGEEVQLWLHVEASGPERDADGDRMSEDALAKMVGYATEKEIPFLDGHYKDLMSAMLGDVKNPYLTEEKHFAFDVLLNGGNPFAVQLFNDVLAGKKHGASIAGVVHAADIEEYGEQEFGSLFHDVELIEVSRTSWPSWRDSFITLLASKVGKLPEAEFEAVMKRRAAILNGHTLKSPQDRFIESVQSEGGQMLVRTADGGVEEWEENDAGDLVIKIISPHGWDEKFSVSDTPWADVEDRTKPCQYAIIRENEDGTFSTSKSGYPHHMPDCGTINRGGCIAAAGRLVQELKSHVPAIETPPIVSLVSGKIGREWLHKQEGAFTTEELKYAANHIIRHYRQDMEEEPPENLVDVAKTYDNETEEIIDLIRGLVRVIEKSAPVMEVKEMPKDEKVVEAPAEEREFTEEQTETVTETEPEKVEPVAEKQEPEEPEVVSEPEIAEEEVESPLGKMVDARLLASKFGELIYAMQEMVLEAVEGQKLEEAIRVLDDFTLLSKDVLTQLIATQPPGEMALSFLGPIESRIELATGRLTKSRVARVDKAIDSVVEHLVNLRELMKNADTTDDMAVLQAAKEAQTVEEKSEHMAKFEERLDQIEARRKSELDRLAATLEEPKREQPAEAETAPVELTPEEKRLSVFQRFEKSVRGG